MDRAEIQHSRDAAIRCGRCRADLSPDEAYRFGDDLLCESCCLDCRATRPRKTHWQYISSIQRDYLKPGKA